MTSYTTKLTAEQAAAIAIGFLGLFDAAELDLLGERCEGYDWLSAAGRLWCREIGREFGGGR